MAFDYGTAGHVLEAIAGASMAGSVLVADGTPSSPRSLLLLLAGILLAVGEVLVAHASGPSVQAPA